MRDRRDCREGGALKLLSRADRITWVRSTLGPGPKTALKVGALVSFASGFPTNFGTATWAVIPRIFPLGWMLELWVGAIWRRWSRAGSIGTGKVRPVELGEPDFRPPAEEQRPIRSAEAERI